MSEHVRIERSGATLAITLDRPERRNAITVAMYTALADAIVAAQDDAELRVISIRGEGESFTAGNDLGDFLQTASSTDEDKPVWRLLKVLARNRVPLVAAVHGNAVGIGTTMLLHCDLVIAAEGTRFTLPFVDLGLVPEAASSLILPRIAGHRHAARYLLLGEPFGAEEARNFGLVSHVVGGDLVEAKLAEIVAALLAKPAEALRLTQRLLREGTSDEFLGRINLENGHFAERLQSEEVKAAIAAFFARVRANPPS